MQVQIILHRLTATVVAAVNLKLTDQKIAYKLLQFYNTLLKALNAQVLLSHKAVVLSHLTHFLCFSCPT